MTAGNIRRRGLILGGAAAGILAARRAFPAEPPPPRLLAFGDSLFEGYGLPPDQGLVPQLDLWLQRQGRKARLINAGLSGDTSYGGRVRIRWSLRHRPDAVIVELGGNDLLAGFGLREIERNLDAILARARRPGGRTPVLLVGIAPPEGAAQIDRMTVLSMWRRLARRHGTLLLPDLYGPLWELPDKDRRHHLQPDGTHLSAQGVGLVIRAGLGPMTARLLDRIGAESSPPDPAHSPVPPDGP